MIEFHKGGALLQWGAPIDPTIEPTSAGRNPFVKQP
jgi:hypothetical protein